MEKKKTTPKKKHGERGKAKPIIDTKKINYENKSKAVEEFVDKIWNEEEKKDEKRRVGRPEVMTKEKLQKLKTCFAVGMNDEEACYFCGISTRSLYYFQEKNPNFLQEKDILKNSITLQAKFNIGRTIKQVESSLINGVQNSWKRLEKMDPSIFGNKIGIGTYNGDIEIKTKAIEKLNSLIK